MQNVAQLKRRWKVGRQWGVGFYYYHTKCAIQQYGDQGDKDDEEWKYIHPSMLPADPGCASCGKPLREGSNI
jgi:hypothetical protein